MGSFRRRIVIVHRTLENGGEARAALEDDFHHFRITLRHEFEHVVQLDGEAPRRPYTLCPSAIAQLPALHGMRLDAIASTVTRATDASQQCTHLLDLAGLAIAAAANRRALRRYDIEVADRVNGRTQALLARDGHPCLDWRLQHGDICAPAPFAGVSLSQGLARWALQELDPDTAEAAIALRRCAMISVGRQKNLDLQVHAEPTGRCFVQQPGRAETALRVIRSTRDFSTSARDLCAEDERWLAFDDPAR